MIIAFYPGAGGNRFLQRRLGHSWTQPRRSYDFTNYKQIYEHRYLLEGMHATAQPYTLTHCMNMPRIQQVFGHEPVVFINSNLQHSLQREWALHGHQRYVDLLPAHTVSRLEHYQAFKAPDWPDVASEAELDQLPHTILQEVRADYAQVVNNTVAPVPSVLTQITQSIVTQINSAYETIVWHQEYYAKYPVDFTGAEKVIDIDRDDLDFCQLMTTELTHYHSEIFSQVWNAVYEQK